MRVSLFVTVFAAAALSACAPGSDETDEQATADETAADDAATSAVVAKLMGADGTEYGEAKISEGENGLMLSLTVMNLEPGSEHGVHIHETGNCEAPDFKSAGGHWNPMGKQHGLENPKGSHFGDFPNLVVDEEGNGTLEAKIASATLNDGDNPLIDEDGGAFVIHAGPDDQTSDPAGDAGARLACGTFG